MPMENSDMKLVSLALGLMFLGLAGCAGGGGARGDSSQPINHEEEIEYRKALTRCYKTGGTRVVKINNYLRCY
jgi:hypothetical protein